MTTSTSQALQPGVLQPGMAPVYPSTQADAASVRQLESNIKSKKWNEKSHDIFDTWAIKLDEKMPNNKVQEALDAFGEKISNLLKPAKRFSKWIDENGHGAWYSRLATFIVKLPVRAIRNILRLTYNIIKAVVYTFVHPIKALIYAAKYFVKFIDSLSRPETWTKIGAGLAGASLGQMAITGGFGPHAYVGLALGGFMMLLGISTGSIIDALMADKGDRLRAAKDALWKNLKAIPEFMLTGFTIGVIFGAITSNLHKQEVTQHEVTDTSNAQNYVNQHLLPQYNLPSPTSVSVDPTGTISATWKGSQLQTLTQSHNQFYIDTVGPGQNMAPTDYNIIIHPPAASPWPANMPGNTNIEVLSHGSNWSYNTMSGQWGTSYPVGPASSTQTVTSVTNVPLIPESTEEMINNYSVIGLAAIKQKRPS